MPAFRHLKAHLIRPILLTRLSVFGDPVPTPAAATTGVQSTDWTRKLS